MKIGPLRPETLITCALCRFTCQLMELAKSESDPAPVVCPKCGGAMQALTRESEHLTRKV
jgi:hypothetical protein